MTLVFLQVNIFSRGVFKLGLSMTGQNSNDENFRDKSIIGIKDILD